MRHCLRSVRPLRNFARFITMRSALLLSAVLPLAQAVRIIQSNDDGWAEINLRTLFNHFDQAGHDVVLSGPAEQQSGTGPSLCLDELHRHAD